MWPAVIIHVAAGGVGIVTGFVALSVRKGEQLHRIAGTAFCLAMLTMAGFAAVLAALGGQRFNTLAGIFTCYLVATGWAAVRRPPGQVGRFERFAPLACLVVIAAGIAFGLQAASPEGLKDGDPDSGEAPTLYLVFAGLSALAAALDLWVIRRGGVCGADRIARHLWRMCLALFVAAGSFFSGQIDEIPQALRGWHLVILQLIPLAALVYWQVRIRFTGARRPTPEAA